MAEGDRSRIAALINSRLRVQDEGTVDDMIVQAESYGVQDLARLEGLLEVIETRLLDLRHPRRDRAVFASGQPRGDRRERLQPQHPPLRQYLRTGAWDHFDELLERIRDIRASEARFYQKVRDILALSEDYDARSPAATTFYATIQNKMLYAVTSHTAGELIRERADADRPNMGLTTWKTADTGGALRKSDVGTAKNYLGEAEIRELNLIVTMFLDTAELRASRRQGMRLADWEGVLDSFLSSNELPKLQGAGTVSAKQAEQIAHDRYAAFDAKRKEAARQAAAEANDLEELQRIANVAKVGKRGRRDA